MAELKGDDELQWSPVVANNSMNRKRKATGINSYEKDTKFNPISFFEKKLSHKSVKWLDLCCGEGNALIETAKYFQHKSFSYKPQFYGIDLVDFFSKDKPDNVSFQTLNLANWQPSEKYDLITCVHGLHYMGDKLGLIAKASRALTPEGIFIGNLDIKNILISDEKDSSKIIQSHFKKHGIQYNYRTKMLHIDGFSKLNTNFKFKGADDQAGSNYTGQEVVNSYYSPLTDK
ncbi:MAG: class I SAM-dependent methyltransferase [Flammeovirgaceae bacterium]|nr:class I SAM-dependent methyltransferase [Flammeovirgaceae bacterium]